MTDLEYIEQEAAATTLSGVQMVKRYGADTSKWPNGHWRNLLDRAAQLAQPAAPSSLAVGTNIYPGEEPVAAQFSKHVRMDRGTPPTGFTICGLIGFDTSSPYALAPIVEVTNEPYFNNWEGLGSCTAWAVKVALTVDAVRARNPTAKILLPLLCQVNNGDIQEAGSWKPMISVVNAAAPGLWAKVDGIALHPYAGAGGSPWTGSATANAVDRVRSQLTALGVTHPFYLTELGWDTNKVTAAAQAQYLGDQLAWAAGRSDVAAAYIFALEDGHDGNYGIAGKPAYQVARGYVGQASVTVLTPPASIPADGSTDAAVGLLAWLESVPDGAMIDFGTGIYRCDTTLEMHGRTLTMTGGSFVQTLPPDDQRAMWRLVGCTVSVPSMRITGSYTNGGVLTDGLQHAHGFDLRGSHINLGAVTVENLAGDGVYFGLGYDSQTRSTGAVTGATLRSLGRNGVSVTAGDGIVISGSTIATVGLDGVDIEPNVASGNWGSDNVVVQGNRFSGVHLYHYSIVEQAPVSRQAFTGNAVTDGPLRVWAGTAGGTVVRPKAVTVRSNTGAAGGTLELSHIDGLAVSGNSGAVSATDCTAVTA